MQDKRLREVKFSRIVSDSHDRVLYNVFGLRQGYEPKTDDYRLVDSAKLGELSTHLKHDATKPLPSKVKIVRTEAHDGLVGIFFKD